MDELEVNQRLAYHYANIGYEYKLANLEIPNDVKIRIEEHQKEIDKLEKLIEGKPIVGHCPECKTLELHRLIHDEEDQDILLSECVKCGNRDFADF